MASGLQFPLECPSCGNFQFFTEVRAQVHKVQFAATHGKVEYGKPEGHAPPVVLRILCGFCNALVHDNQIPEPAASASACYRDAQTFFGDDTA